MGCKTNKCKGTSMCECPVKVETKCITFSGCDVEAIGVSTGDNLNDVIKSISKAIENKEIKLSTVGDGAEVYKGLSDNGIYEFKSLLAQDGVIIEEKENTIIFKVDESFLEKWLDKNLKNSLTADMLKGIFNEEEFKKYFSTYLQDILNRPEVKKFFEDYLWTIFGSQEFQEKFIDFLKVIYNEETWKSFYEDYLRMMFNRKGFKDFFATYLQAVFNTADFKDFLEGYLLLLFNRQPFKDWVISIVTPLLANLTPQVETLSENDVRNILRNFLLSDEFCQAVKRCVPDTFYDDLRNAESERYIKSLFDKFYADKDLKPAMVNVIKEYLKEPDFKKVVKDLFDEFIEGVDFCDKVKDCIPARVNQSPTLAPHSAVIPVNNKIDKDQLLVGYVDDNSSAPSAIRFVYGDAAPYFSKSIVFNREYPIDYLNGGEFNFNDIPEFGDEYCRSISYQVKDNEGAWSAIATLTMCKGARVRPNDAYLNDVVYRLDNRESVTLRVQDFANAYVDPGNDEPFAGRKVRIANALGGRLKYNGVALITGQEIESFNLGLLTYDAKDQNAAYTEEVTIELV